MASIMLCLTPERALECRGSTALPPGLELPAADLAPPGLDDCPPHSATLPAPPGLDDLNGLGKLIGDATQGKAEVVLEGCGGAQGESFHASMTEAQAWWWHYSSMGGGQAPWMGLAQYDPAEPISIVSSDSSPTGCGQWWQRSGVGWKTEARERFWSGSTMAGSVMGTDEPSSDANDDECTFVFSEDDEEACVPDEHADGDEDADGDEWTVGTDFGQVCDLCDDEFNFGSSEQGADVEEFAADEHELHNSLASGQVSNTEDLPIIQKPFVAWTKAPAQSEAAEVKAPAAHFSMSDFPSLNAAQPRRRGGRS